MKPTKGDYILINGPKGSVVPTEFIRMVAGMYEVYVLEKIGGAYRLFREPGGDYSRMIKRVEQRSVVNIIPRESK